MSLRHPTAAMLGVVGRVALGLASSMALAGCGEDGVDAPASVPRSIDPFAGTLGPIQLGENRPSVEQALGRGRVGEFDPIWPTGVEDAFSSTAPPSFDFPRRPGDGPLFVRYPTITVVLDRDKVHLIVAMARGTTAGRGLEIGDELDEARRAYPTLSCSTATGSHGDALFPYCTGRVAEDRYLWAAGDPIRSFAIAKGRMSG